MEKFGVRRSTILPLPSSPHCAPSTAMFILFRGASPRRTPLHAPSLAASPARSVRVAHSLTLVRFLSGGFRPAGPPYTLPRSPLRRLAPFAWLTHAVRPPHVHRHPSRSILLRLIILDGETPTLQPIQATADEH